MHDSIPSQLWVGRTAVVATADVDALRVLVFLQYEELARVLLDLGLEVPRNEHGAVHARSHHEEAELLPLGLALAQLKPHDIIVLQHHLNTGERKNGYSTRLVTSTSPFVN